MSLLPKSAVWMPRSRLYPSSWKPREASWSRISLTIFCRAPEPPMAIQGGMKPLESTTSSPWRSSWAMGMVS